MSDTYRVTEPVMVKKSQRQISIRPDSHPTQQAKVGDSVDLRLETDGLIERIEWNFGNLKTTSCDDRTCSSTTVTYLEPGDYIITAEVFYPDESPVIARLKLRVFE